MRTASILLWLSLVLDISFLEGFTCLEPRLKHSPARIPHFSTAQPLWATRPTVLEPRTEHAVQEFCDRVQNSLDKQEFCSLVLKGPNKNKTKKKKKKSLGKSTLSSENDDDRLRGCLHQVRGRLISSKKDHVLLQVTLKYHGATDLVQNWRVSKVADELKTFLYEGRASEWGTWYPTGTALGIHACQMVTTRQQWDVDLRTGKWRSSLVENAPAAIEAHDRQKQVPVATEAPFWQALGLLSRTKKSKQRQCQKFVEIVRQLVQTSLQDHRHSVIETVDMGCGRGYLTFALHHYLSSTYVATDVRTRGIDMRPKLIVEMNGIARSLGMNGLIFEEGTIEGYLSSQEQAQEMSPPETLRLLIALHACDTATDDALWSALKSNADIIVVAPCCHKEVRPQLDRHAKSVGEEHPYYDVFRHNIYRDRTAETVTDSMRALLLEIADYQTQVFEFIGGEHTSKNVMITAVKKGQQGNQKESLRSRLRNLAKLHGIRRQRLAEWMGEDIASDREDGDSSPASNRMRGMPAL